MIQDKMEEKKKKKRMRVQAWIRQILSSSLLITNGINSFLQTASLPFSLFFNIRFYLFYNLWNKFSLEKEKKKYSFCISG